MHAFDEPIICQECGDHVGGIVRAGLDALSYGKPFDFAVVYIRLKAMGKAIIKALVSEDPNNTFARPHYKAIYDTVAAGSGLEPDWERHKNG